MSGFNASIFNKQTDSTSCAHRVLAEGLNCKGAIRAEPTMIILEQL